MNRAFWRQNTTLMNRAFWRQNTTLMNRAFWRQNTRIHFTRSAPPLLYSWSGSPTGSDYFSLYISSCFRLNKLLTNLTSSRQHHLQYTGGLAETHGLLLPFFILWRSSNTLLYSQTHQFFSEFFKENIVHIDT
jgi:hypothetical protein